MKIDEFRAVAHQYEKEPMIFFVPVLNCDRSDLYKMTRKELMEIASIAIPLSEFDTDWNDSDSSIGEHVLIPRPYKTWCKVSLP